MAQPLIGTIVLYKKESNEPGPEIQPAIITKVVGGFTVHLTAFNEWGTIIKINVEFDGDRSLENSWGWL